MTDNIHKMKKKIEKIDFIKSAALRYVLGTLNVSYQWNGHVDILIFEYFVFLAIWWGCGGKGGKFE